MDKETKLGAVLPGGLGTRRPRRAGVAVSIVQLLPLLALRSGESCGFLRSGGRECGASLLMVYRLQRRGQEAWKAAAAGLTSACSGSRSFV